MRMRFLRTRPFLSALIIVELATILILALYVSARNRTLFSSIPIKNGVRIESRYPGYYEPHPDMQFVRPSSVSGEATYLYNADNLHDRFDYERQKPQGTFRIAMLGDSFTFGLFVNTGENYTELLEDILRAKSCTASIEVINFGVPGYDIAYAREFFRLRGSTYDPDLVIWQVALRDFYDFPAGMTVLAEKYRKTYPLEGQEEYYDDYGGPPWDRQAREEFNALYGEDNIVDLQTRELLSIREDFPNELVIMSPDMGNLPRAADDQLDALVKRDKRVHLLLLDMLEQKDYLPDGHFNTSGHAKVAAFLADHLTKNSLVPCETKP